MNTLADHLKDSALVVFNEEFYWRTVNCGNRAFRDVILSSLFCHSELKIGDLP